MTKTAQEVQKDQEVKDVYKLRVEYRESARRVYMSGSLEKDEKSVRFWKKELKNLGVELPYWIEKGTYFMHPKGKAEERRSREEYYLKSFAKELEEKGWEVEVNMYHRGGEIVAVRK